MTRISTTTLRSLLGAGALVGLVSSLAAPASAVLSDNGVHMNGIHLNALSDNALTDNGAQASGAAFDFDAATVTDATLPVGAK